jgi:diacylglycerol O-acyltransferase / wax synthase
MNVPLDDHAAMYVAASRLRNPPCVGVVRRFDELVAQQALTAHARELAANPNGFGRRVVAPRIPGARARWRPASELPPLRIEPEALSAAALADLLDDEASTHPDPSRDAGWRLAAVAESEGGTLVMTWLHHAYGDGRAILEHAFAPASGEPAPPAPSRGSTMLELGDVVVRVRQGLGGSARLGREVALPRWRTPHGELARLRPALDALGRRDRSVGSRSQRRVVALARMDGEAWESAAKARGGTGNALLIAVLANLLRRARRSRGEQHERPLRVLVPVDMRLRRAGSPRGAATNAAAAAIVELGDHAPAHERLDEEREATWHALRLLATARSLARPPRPPGTVDAMQLLPSSITHRLAARVQADVDGVASNVGSFPAHVAQLGSYIAREVYPLASPMRTDVTVCLGRDRTHATLGVVADPARLGPSGTLREQVADELSAWGVEADVR